MDQPTQSAPLLNDSAADRDLLDFSPYTLTLLDIIRDPETKGPLVIGLFGTWGSGKTSLMQFVQNDLAQDQAHKFRCVWFDAWKYEKEDALWRALLLRVIDSLRSFEDGKDVTEAALRQDIEKLEQRLYRDIEWEEKGKLTLDVPTLVKGAAGTTMQLAVSMLPGFAAEAVKAAQEALGQGENAGTLLDAFQRDVIKYHQEQLRSIEQFQKEFGALIEKHVVANQQRLVVFVDDLDRCLPDKSIQVLEAIKLFLDVKGCIFLLGLDQDVVTRGIKVKYREFAVDEGAGSEKRIPIDGAAYLEKIIQLPFRLPRIEPSSMKPFVTGLAAFSDSRCGDVFAEGPETNPRKVKRAINIFLFISRLAERRRIPIQHVRLAKIVVIYHSHPELYEMLRLNPALLRDLEAFLRQQTTTPLEAGHGMKTGGAEVAEREAKQAPAAPVASRLVTDSLKRVLTLFLEDDVACFLKADYTELASYFTLTRGTIVETPAVTTPESATRIALAFPVPTFVRVPAGEFVMGTSDADIELLLEMKDTHGWAKEWKEKGYFNDEQPQHRFTLLEFQISKYPVTNAQYQAFIKDSESQAPSYWSGDSFPEELAAHPVVNVSWLDAVAYCEWLTKQLRAANQLRESGAIRLPTEAEWEKAASWDDEKREKRTWAWGNQWDATKCNTSEGKIGRTTPVGKYSPSGDSFYGLADMSGNVWEWCSTLHKDYPYDLNDGREDTRSSGLRVLRGGSWHDHRGLARCAYRLRINPDYRINDIGFRAVESVAP